MRLLFSCRAGGNDPSNWLADIRFFNPADPTGVLGLPATVTQAYFARDAGRVVLPRFSCFLRSTLPRRPQTGVHI